MSNQEGKRQLLQQDHDADYISEHNDKEPDYSDEVMASTVHKPSLNLQYFVLSNTFLLHFHLPDSTSQKAKINCPWGALWRGGQRPEE